MTAIPFPISSAPGLKPQEGAGRLINCFAVATEKGARFPVVWRRSAGLRELVTVASHVHLRGAIDVSGTLIAVFNSRAHTITESGGVFTDTNVGALAGSDRVTLAKNNAATPNIVCVTSAGAKNLYTGSAPDDFADSDLPQPVAVCEYKSYLVFPIGDGRLFVTGINNVSVSTSGYTTCPGPLLRAVSFRGELFAFGTTFVQPYHDVGASPFPFEPSMTGGGVIPRGLAGTHAVAGWEPGWVGKLIWAADDGTVCQLNGYTAEPISNDDVTRDVAAAIKAGDGSLLEADVYSQGAHSFWRLTYPGNWSWEYNATTQNWNERVSYGRDDCRASFTVRAFDRWVTGDRVNGKVYEVDETYFREGDQPLRMILRSGATAAFPQRLAIHRMDFDFTAAVGSAGGEDPVQTDPTVLIRWSKDGGYSFGNPVSRKLGAQGVGNNRVTVWRGPTTGPRGIVVEVEVADPVHAGFMGATAEIEPRAA